MLVIICITVGTFHGTPQGVSKGPGGIIAEVSTLLAEEVEWGSHEVVRLLGQILIASLRGGRGKRIS